MFCNTIAPVPRASRGIRRSRPASCLNCRSRSGPNLRAALSGPQRQPISRMGSDRSFGARRARNSGKVTRRFNVVVWRLSRRTARADSDQPLLFDNAEAAFGLPLAEVAIHLRWHGHDICPRFGGFGWAASRCSSRDATGQPGHQSSSVVPRRRCTCRALLFHRVWRRVRRISSGDDSAQRDRADPACC